MLELCSDLNNAWLFDVTHMPQVDETMKIVFRPD